MAKKKQMPEQVYLYISDYDADGAAIYGVALNIEEIPDDESDVVGVYDLIREAKLIISRDLE